MSISPDPLHPITAINAAEANRGLMRFGEFFWSDHRSCWVATSAASVKSVLTCPGMAVRPAHEPIPIAFATTSLGRVFGNLVRMCDGETHVRRRGAVDRALAQISPQEVESATRRVMHAAPGSGGRHATDTIGIAVVADLLGIGEDEHPTVVKPAQEFTRAIGPTATADDIMIGISATDRLWEWISALLDHQDSPSSLLTTLHNALQEAGESREVTIANAIGLLFQACDSMAGLIGSGVLALDTNALSIPEAIDVVLREQAPIQNTRRWVTIETDLEIPGSPIDHASLKQGDPILIVLAAANLDPNASPQSSWSFGVGVHACPGEAIARSIAQTALAVLSERIGEGANTSGPSSSCHYRPSANARIPILDSAGEPS